MIHGEHFIWKNNNWRRVTSLPRISPATSANGKQQHRTVNLGQHRKNSVVLAKGRFAGAMRRTPHTYPFSLSLMAS